MTDKTCIRRKDFMIIVEFLLYIYLETSTECDLRYCVLLKDDRQKKSTYISVVYKFYEALGCLKVALCKIRICRTQILLFESANTSIAINSGYSELNSYGESIRYFIKGKSE